MVRSMTGFGLGRASDPRATVSVELRSVNAKSCDVRVSFPRELAGLELNVQHGVEARVQRGRVDAKVSVEIPPDRLRRPRLNQEVARAYLAVYRDLGALLGAPLASIELVAAAPGVIEIEPGPSQDDLLPLVQSALDQALSELISMRSREGAALGQALIAMLDELDALLTKVIAELPGAAVARRARFEQRIAELTAGNVVDPMRLAQEVALLIDRADVSEELTRLDSHRDHFLDLLAQDEPVGRRLDFLLQEMHREANTLGAKSSSAAISHLVIEAKSLLERLREQVQNVE